MSQIGGNVWHSINSVVCATNSLIRYTTTHVHSSFPRIRTIPQWQDTPHVLNLPLLKMYTFGDAHFWDGNYSKNGSNKRVFNKPKTHSWVVQGVRSLNIMFLRSKKHTQSLQRASYSPDETEILHMQQLAMGRFEKNTSSSPTKAKCTTKRS